MAKIYETQQDVERDRLNQKADKAFFALESSMLGVGAGAGSWLHGILFNKSAYKMPGLALTAVSATIMAVSASSLMRIRNRFQEIGQGEIFYPNESKAASCTEISPKVPSSCSSKWQDKLEEREASQSANKSQPSF